MKRIVFIIYDLNIFTKLEIQINIKTKLTLLKRGFTIRIENYLKMITLTFTYETKLLSLCCFYNKNNSLFLYVHLNKNLPKHDK